MNILVVGSGGREHAIIKKLRESSKAGKIWCAPGNGGIAADAECVNIGAMDIEGVVAFAKANPVDLVFVAPDDPLAAGMVDALTAAGVRAFGPTKAAAQLEASKVFSKNLMQKYNIPTAKYGTFSDPAEAVAYIEAEGKFPVVVKADGLALGKGVLIAEDFEAAKAAVRSIMEEKAFGESGSRVVVEEFMAGPEVTVLAFADGKTVKPMVSSMDHKRALDGDKGLNTGGMGTVSPNPHYTPEIEKRCMEEIFLPTIRATQAEGIPFKGCLYFGLMLTPDGPKVVEYNSRFGDPETQVVLPRLDTDFIDVIDACIDGTLDSLDIRWKPGAAACVCLASGGYPEAYKKGLPISGLDEKGQAAGVTVYHAGTKLTDGVYCTNGGRVLGVTATADTLEEALAKAYDAVKGISFENVHYRTDIGQRALKHS